MEDTRTRTHQFSPGVIGIYLGVERKPQAFQCGCGYLFGGTVVRSLLEWIDTHGSNSTIEIWDETDALRTVRLVTNGVEVLNDLEWQLLLSNHDIQTLREQRGYALTW